MTSTARAAISVSGRACTSAWARRRHDWKRRVAFEEVLKRWPDWEVDYANAQRGHTASVRGRARLPVVTGRLSAPLPASARPAGRLGSSARPAGRPA